MQQVGTHDKRWHVELDYSTSNREWTVALDYWERPGPFSDWQLEGRWVSPCVALGHLRVVLDEALQELAQQVASETSESLER